MLWKLLKFFKLLVLAPALHMLPGSFFFLPSLDDGTHGALQANKEGKKAKGDGRGKAFRSSSPRIIIARTEFFGGGGGAHNV
jgi:hypothetical protein